MALTLNHFSIRTTDLDASRRFYADVLGLSVGPRPDFPFPGLWMYRGDHGDVANAVVHLIGIDRSDPEGLKKYLGDRDEAALARRVNAKVRPGAPIYLVKAKLAQMTYYLRPPLIRKDDLGQFIESTALKG